VLQYLDAIVPVEVVLTAKVHDRAVELGREVS
jgi:hypothetical protein